MFACKPKQLPAQPVEASAGQKRSVLKLCLETTPAA